MLGCPYICTYWYFWRVCIYKINPHIHTQNKHHRPLLHTIHRSIHHRIHHHSIHKQTSNRLLIFLVNVLLRFDFDTWYHVVWPQTSTSTSSSVLQFSFSYHWFVAVWACLSDSVHDTPMLHYYINTPMQYSPTRCSTMLPHIHTHTHIQIVLRETISKYYTIKIGLCFLSMWERASSERERASRQRGNWGRFDPPPH